MKKGRHRRFEEARALKRSHEVDLEGLFEDISDAPEGEHKPEHDAWADLAEEWDSKDPEPDADAAADDASAASSDEQATKAEADDHAEDVEDAAS